MNQTVTRLPIWIALFCVTPLFADTTTCSNPVPPNVISENALAPTENVISLGTAETLTDVNISVDITHDFIDDITLDIESPGGTVVRLHNMTGTSDFIIITFDDQGVSNGSVEFDSGCQVQPSGPGTLGDFNGQSSQGDWTLRILDNFMGGATGILSAWCLETFNSGINPPVLPVENLLCTSVGATGIVDLEWTNPLPYSSIDIASGGVVIGSVAGTQTSFSSPPLTFGQVAEFSVVAKIGTATPCFSPTCSITPQSNAADFEVCSVPGSLISNSAPPTVDTILVTTDIILADLQVQVDVTHPFIGDLTMDLNHGPVTLRFHDEVGGPLTRVQASFWDLGIVNGNGGWDCGCLMMPSGPGSLSDFFGLSSLGSWTLTVADVFSGPTNIGELASWCVRGYETGSVNQLSCVATSGSSTANLSWTNPQTFDLINVYADGLLEAVLPGTATNYAAVAQLIPSTVDYCLEPILAGQALGQNCCVVDFFVEPVTVGQCSSATGSGFVEVSWTNPAVVYDSISVSVNGQLEATLSGTATSYTTAPVGMVPSTVEVCIVGTQGNATSAAACCSIPVLAPVDLEVCRTPGALVPINQSVSPVTDVMLVPSNLLIGELNVLIDISHTFVGDLIVDLNGPNGAVVRLHDEEGVSDADLVVLYDDLGGPNTAPYNCGCPMVPAGPGTLADFSNIAAIGAWSLRIEDTFGGNTGFLDKWCLRIVAGCQVTPPTDTSCVSDGTQIQVQWTNGAVYDAIDINRDGVVIATIAGTATSYLDLTPGIGVHEYRVFGVDNALGCSNAGVPAKGGAGVTDMIFAGDTGGAISSPADLELSLFANGRIPMVIDSFDPIALSTVGTFDIAWICLGTFPNEHELSPTEALLLAEIHTGDVGLNGSIDNPPTAVYIESADHWAFDPSTVFENYDGVENDSFGNLSNGNDSVVNLVGKDTALGGLTLVGLDGIYVQDSGGNDFSDRLVPCSANPDFGGPTAAVTWSADDFGNPYDVGVYYLSTIAPVITQSWEFGGYGADQVLLASIYVSALSAGVPPPTDAFIRGDVNDDSGVNVADAIFLLNSLFLPNQDLPPCRRSADGNDDNSVNIADAIFILNALFVPNSDPIPPPNLVTGCADDPTPGGLPCLLTGNCP